MKIKICGITNTLDARFAIENGADLIGFVFFRESPRYVSPDKAKRIIEELPKETVTTGVFVNETNKNMISISKFCGLHTLQLHGQETIKQINELKDIGLIKAFAPKNERDLVELHKFHGYTLLIDTPSDNHGGSGKIGNWELAKKISLRYQIFLAGGLTCENVVNAITTVRPYGVDVSSGVEKDKGIKNHDKVQRFIESVRKFS